MKLIVVNSNSTGNAYALASAGGEILLLEAGIRMAEVKRAIDYRLSEVVGCIVTHAHGDHAKYATEYAKFGVKVYCNEDVASKKQFPYDSSSVVRDGITKKIGSFRITPFDVAHDVPCLGYLIHHPEMGIMLFATDTYKVPLNITGIDHYLIEANYSDALLKQNVWNGSVNKVQADRIMLSHMSLDYTVRYLRDCIQATVGGASAPTTKTVTLCHLSERNSDPSQFKRTVESALGIPTYIARKGLVVELNKEVI